MRAKITYFVTAAVLVVYFVLAGSRGVCSSGRAPRSPSPSGSRCWCCRSSASGSCGRPPASPPRADRLARELDAEGGLPVDELVRTPSGRIDRDSADAVFARRRTETEAAPEDWRSWFRLAVAYHDARDTPRARKAMQRAIALHDGRPVRA